MLSVESQPTFRRDMSAPFLGSKKVSHKLAWKQVASRVVINSYSVLVNVDM
jgi:hypothetical protein